jgi:hypothetical protein
MKMAVILGIICITLTGCASTYESMDAKADRLEREMGIESDGSETITIRR